jgi:hypothetical protein
MDITRELLLAKKAELQKAYDDALAQSQAFGGALQFCQHLIDELDKEQEPDDSNAGES